MKESGLHQHILNAQTKDKWDKISTKKRSGVVAPLFSIYSQQSLGIGDFADLKLFIDWCHNTGNSIIQLLPMNEVGSVFCPYDSISSFALEPAYISLISLEYEPTKSITDRIIKIRENFPAGSPHVDYAIKDEKIKLLEEIFSLQTNLNSLEFRRFIDNNAYWITDFALYKAFKRYHEGKAWFEWQDTFKNRSRSGLDEFKKQYEREISFHMWVQWQLFRQLKSVRQYALSKGVFLKGDLPILVSRDSADVWAHPDFFKLEYAAGAPPDMYCAKGQRWGMPTYKWDNIAVDNYRYVKEKLKYAENFYDILRIDHVVGLFRIWSIPFHEPQENQGLHGFFDPSDESQWKEHGKNLLSVINANTDMLLCAEDLGIIPKSCTDTLKEMGIPGNDVERWVKDWHVRHDFLYPNEYRQLSVAMLSTHDTTNWPAWWENEAGTVDEALFTRKCAERHIDFRHVKDRLFNSALSGHGRLRWLDHVASIDVLVDILGKRKDEVGDFIDLYLNTYHEKEKLWKLLELPGLMREACDSQILKQVLKFTLESNAIFCVNLLIDWLYLADLFKGKLYQYRINTPGTVNPLNWSLTMPISLEELEEHKVTRQIKEMVVSSGRI